MITRQVVSEKLLAYLNADLTLVELVDWAENCFIDGGFIPLDDSDMLIDIVMYLAGADTEMFPLTWNIITQFLAQLEAPVRVVPA
jgi:hypothetical protein